MAGASARSLSRPSRPGRCASASRRTAELSSHRDRAANTVRRVYTVLRSVFNVAIERRYIGVNPCDAVRLRRITARHVDNGHGQEDVRVIVTEAEARALADAIDPAYRLLVLVTAYTGMRAGEVRALRRRGYNALKKQLHVQRAVKEVTAKEAAEERERGAEVYGNLVFGPTKTFERRRITLPPWLAAELEEHLDSRPASPSVLIFTTPSGEPIRQSNFYRRFFKPAVRHRFCPDPRCASEVPEDAKRCPECDSPVSYVLPPDKHDLRFHDLRHSHASWLIAGGAQPLQVMKRLGHRDIRTTYNTYGHMFPSDEEALASLFDAKPHEPDNVTDLRATTGAQE